MRNTIENSGWRQEPVLNIQQRKIRSEETVMDPKMCASKAADVAVGIIHILSQNYGTHNLASNIAPLEESIKSGQIKAFLKIDQNLSPVACAALVKINDKEVELGRAACVKGANGGNGQLMIEAFNQWEEGKLFPESKILRAEVRTAKSTKEVPGGQATQAICLRKIGFVPTAMAPMFHHGIPDRQEIFLLASILRDKNMIDLQKQIPSSIGDDLEKESFNIFWKKFFGEEAEFVEVEEGEIKSNFEAKVLGPFVELRETRRGNRAEAVVNPFFEEGGRFALARISLERPTEVVAAQSVELKKMGFRLAGFEPVIRDGEISIDILFGKLSKEGKEVMVLPSFTEGVFSHREEEILIQNSIQWRQN